MPYMTEDSKTLHAMGCGKGHRSKRFNAGITLVLDHGGQIARRGDGVAGQLVGFAGDKAVEQGATEYGCPGSTSVIASEVMISADPSGQVCDRRTSCGALGGCGAGADFGVSISGSITGERLVTIEGGRQPHHQ